jgi:hypothetical protein
MSILQIKFKFKYNLGESLDKTKKAIIPEVMVNNTSKGKIEELIDTINNNPFVAKILENVTRQSNLLLLNLEELEHLKLALQNSPNEELQERKEELETVYMILDSKIERLKHPVTIDIIPTVIQARLNSTKNN